MAISVCTSTKQQNCMRALVAMRHLVYKNREDLSVGHRDQGSRQKKEVKSDAISRCGFMDHANKNKTQNVFRNKRRSDLNAFKTPNRARNTKHSFPNAQTVQCFQMLRRSALQTHCVSPAGMSRPCRRKTVSLHARLQQMLECQNVRKLSCCWAFVSLLAHRRASCIWPPASYPYWQIPTIPP